MVGPGVSLPPEPVPFSTGLYSPLRTHWKFISLILKRPQFSGPSLLYDPQARSAAGSLRWGVAVKSVQVLTECYYGPPTTLRCWGYCGKQRKHSLPSSAYSPGQKHWPCSQLPQRKRQLTRNCKHNECFVLN